MNTYFLVCILGTLQMHGSNVVNGDIARFLAGGQTARVCL